jgi:hypothetical protein
VRVAEREHDHVLALQLGAVADADDVEVLGPAGGDAGDGVEDQRAGQAMNAACLSFSRSRSDCRPSDQRDAAGKQRGDLALGAFDQNGVAVSLTVYLTPRAAGLASCRYVTLKILYGLRVREAIDADRSTAADF